MNTVFCIPPFMTLTFAEGKSIFLIPNFYTIFHDI